MRALCRGEVKQETATQWRRKRQDSRSCMCLPTCSIHSRSGESSRKDILRASQKRLSGESVFVDGGYPVDISEDMCTLLGMADHNERQESEDVYPAFAEAARQEGYGKIAQDFTNIAKIENVHGKRFAAFGKLMKEGKLFSSSQSETWVC